MSDDGEIRNLIGAYSQTVDDRRFDDLRQILADEFTFEIGQQCFDGADAFVARLSSREPFAERRCHATANAVVDVDAGGEHATATVDLIYVGLADGGQWTILNRARYHDRLIKRDGRWLFLSRSVT
jgi:SnoaL-like domain